MRPNTMMSTLATLLGVMSTGCGASQDATLPRDGDVTPVTEPEKESTEDTQISTVTETASPVEPLSDTDLDLIETTKPETLMDTDAVEPRLADARPNPDGNCEEMGYRCYRPVTLDALVSGKAAPGRVAVTLTPTKHVPCAPCPRNARCQPCSQTVVFKTSDTADEASPYLTLFSGDLKKAPHRLFLCLDKGNARHVNGYPGDPRVAAIELENAVPISELSTHPDHRRTAATISQRVPQCRTTFVRSSVMTEKNRTPDLAAVATVEAVSPADDPLDAEKSYTVTVRLLEMIRGVASKNTLQCQYSVESRRRSLPLDEPIVAAISMNKTGCLLDGIWRVSQLGMFKL